MPIREGDAHQGPFPADPQSVPEWTHDFSKREHQPCRVYTAELHQIHAVRRCNVNTGIAEVYSWDGKEFVIDRRTMRVSTATIHCKAPLVIQDMEFDSMGNHVSPLLIKADS